jgi:nucleotidyltransferase/DNA polymerase involved in DNA repair
MRPRFIGHIDGDCFYVSAERVRFPFLRSKPVAVLGNQGACVIAKSYEMKAAGVTTGEPIWEAREKCPAGVYLKRDFRWYEVLSRRMLAVVREFSPAVEFYSIDEFFFDAEPAPGRSRQVLAEALRDCINEVVGVPVTVGVARSKALAKLVSDTAKPFGALALTDPDAERALLEQRPVTDITGIAARRAARLEALGVRTCLDFALTDRKRIRKLLTVVGEELWHELNGTAVRPLLTDRPPHKALSRGGSLGEAAADADRLHAWLARNTEWLVEELEYHVAAAGRLQVYLGHRDTAGGGYEIDLAQPTDRFDRLLGRIRELRAQGLLFTEVAERLNAEGFRPLKQAERFSRSTVWRILRQRSPSPKPLLERWRGELQKDAWFVGDVCVKLGIPRKTLHAWLRRGWVRYRALTGPRAPWACWADAEELRRLRRLRETPHGWWDPPLPTELTTPRPRQAD